MYVSSNQNKHKTTIRFHITPCSATAKNKTPEQKKWFPAASYYLLYSFKIMNNSLV